jgi:hypothetical protein
MRLAGALDIGIELSLYWPSTDENDLEVEEEDVSADSNTDG